MLKNADLKWICSEKRICEQGKVYFMI